MKNIAHLFIFFLAISCSEKTNESNPLIQEIQNEIGILFPKSIKVGDDFLAKMYSLDANSSIVNALVDCKDFSKIDSSDYKVEGCFKELLIKNDTVYLAFSPSISGEFTFDEISILTKNQSGRDLKINKIEIEYTVID